MTEEVKEDGKGAGPSSEDDCRVKRVKDKDICILIYVMIY